MELLKLSKLCVTGAAHLPVTDIENGEICCITCGVVMSDVISVVSEPYDKDGASRSQHFPVNYAMGDRALGSLITKSGSGKKLNYTTKLIVVGKGQAKGLIEFRKVSDKLNLPEYVVEEATKCFVFIRKKGFLKGREINSIVGACIYLFSKKNGLNLTLKQICEKLSINQKVLYSHYSDLCKKLDIDFSNMSPSLPIDYVEQLCSKFKLDRKIRIKCVELVKNMQDKQFHVGKNPTAVAIGGIYLACTYNNYFVSQSDLSVLSGVSAVTIRNISNRFNKILNN